jgi:hypothetical protein
MRFEPNAVSPNVIGGNPANTVTSGVRGATIAGGGVPAGATDPDFSLEAPNRVTDAYGAVGGGYGNRAGDDQGSSIDAAFATIAGGFVNIAGSPYSSVGGGFRNVVSGASSTVAGGDSNLASGDYTAIGGGVRNQATNANATIGGGYQNLAGGATVYNTVAGGAFNEATGGSATVGGGTQNRSTGLWSTVPGGDGNEAQGTYSFAAGRMALAGATGAFALADGTNATFTNFTPNAFQIGFSGGIGLYTNKAKTSGCTVSPTGDFSCTGTIAGAGGGGDITGVAAGTGLAGGGTAGDVILTIASGYQLPQSCANGQVAKSNGAGGWTCGNDLAGGGVTSITAGTGLTGGTITTNGTVAADTAYLQRRVSGTCPAGSSIRVIAADGNVTCETDDTGAANAFVQGGNAFGANAVLAVTDGYPLQIRSTGGVSVNGWPQTPNIELTIISRTSSDAYANFFMRPYTQNGGILLSVDNPVLGSNAAQLYIDQFDGTTQVRRMFIDKAGRVAFNRESTSVPCQGIGCIISPTIDVPLSVGTDGTNGNQAYLSQGGSWTNGSSREFKQAFAAVDTADVLARVLALPISTWEYRQSNEGRHIGPMAEDFSAAFGLGRGDRYIATVDTDGVALAAIQGLNAKVEALLVAKDREIAALEARIAEQQRVVAMQSQELLRVRATHDVEVMELRRAVDVLLVRTSPEGRMAQSH